MMEQAKIILEILSKQEKYHFVGLMAAVIIMAFLQALGVASILPLINLVVEPGIVYQNRWLWGAYNIMGFQSISGFTVAIGLMMFGLILVTNVFSALATWLKIKFVWMNNHRLSRRLLQKYLSMPYGYFLSQNSSDLGKNVLSEVNMLAKGYFIPLLDLITKTIMALLILLLLLWVDLIVTLFALLVLGGSYAAIYLFIRLKLKSGGEKRMQANKQRYKAVNEAFSGIKEIKIMNKESFFLHTYSQASKRHAALMSWSAVIGQVPRYAMEAVAFGGILLFVLYHLVRNDNAAQIVPMASLYAFAGYRLMPALQEIFHSFTQIQFSQAVLYKIHYDLSNYSAPKNKLNSHTDTEPAPLSVVNEIRLEGVTYCYPKTSIPILKKINLSISCNSAVAFVGPTGGGKTTLVDIISGLLVPSMGRLIVDGQIIGEHNVRSWQKNIGYVPQHIYLSDDTVTRNIAFGVPDDSIDMGAVKKAARIANIDDFISSELPGGYHTVIGERGIRLSGGQRQRIGIARALYHDPEVLVFDEATSAMDGVTEEAVHEALAKAAQSKTLIVVAHRLTTVLNCDMIYLLDKGSIVGQGAFEQLVATNKQFQDMTQKHRPAFKHTGETTANDST